MGLSRSSKRAGPPAPSFSKLAGEWPLYLDRKAAANSGSLETTASDIREKEDVVQEMTGDVVKLTENRR